jgi:hypothetical protein
MLPRPLLVPLLPTLVALAALAGCASLSPRFPANVQAAFARDPMRKLETRALELYYPAERKAEALRMAARLEACVDRLNARAVSPPGGRVLVFMTSADFNNAYVQPLSPNVPQQMVLPEHFTLELFNWFQLGTGDVADVACHEAVHYVQMQQVGGVWPLLNALTGGVLQPNVFTEGWFLEGLATYYEGRLGRRVGRPHSPFFRGWWESGVASEAGLNPGYLNSDHRDVLPNGGSYQTGLAFVEWLAARHGEEKLWRYVENVGSGITLNLGLTLRFASVYGMDIGDAFAAFEKEERARLAQRQRPAPQQVLARDLGYVARLAASPSDGALAVAFVSRTQASTLRVLERDGRVRLETFLTPLLPPRPHIASGPLSLSGLAFTPDGQGLLALLADVDVDGNTLSRLVRLDARTGAVVRTWDGLTGLGGDVTPDGRGYVYVDVRGDSANLMRLDLESGGRVPLTGFTGRTSLAPPAVSPDGRRIAFARFEDGRFDLYLREEDGALRRLTDDAAMDYAPRWLDAGRLVLLREVEGRAQVHVLDVDAGGAPAPVTDAPFLALDPVPTGDGRVAFLNREAWSWTLDTVPLPAPGEAPASPTASPTEALTEALAVQPAVFTQNGVQQGAQDALEARDATEAPPEALAAPEPPVTVLSDAPYSPLDGLFVPQLHTPFLSDVRLPSERTREDGTVQRQRLGAVYGLSLSGADRLSFHSWALNLTFDTDQRGPAVDAAYGNFQLAPWFLFASFQRQPLGPVTAYAAQAGLSRSFWTTPVSLSLLGYRQDVKAGAGPEFGGPAQLLGPSASVEYSAGDSTVDGGTQRLLGVSLRGGAYAAEAGGARALVGDARLQLTGAVPVPLLPTDSLVFSVFGRTLPGAPQGLLRVGGVASGVSNLDLSLPAPRTPEEPRRGLPGVGFREPLRGYEDFQLAATSVGVATARYRANLPIDHGWASFLWLLPSFFVRQLEGELFGTWATTRLGGWRNHRVGGASVALRTVFGDALPVSLRYQVALRADDGLGPLHLVTFALE